MPRKNKHLMDRGARINRHDLAVLLFAKDDTMTLEQCEYAVKEMADILAEAMVRNQKIVIQEFGILENHVRKGRMGTHPSTGEPRWYSETVLPYFRPAAALGKAVKEAAPAEQVRRELAARKKKPNGAGKSR